MPNKAYSTIGLVTAGDPIITRRISNFEDERFDELLGVIRGADASVVNLEVSPHDYEGYPAEKGAGTPLTAPPWSLDELSWAGFDMFAAATNHTGDYSHDGMKANMRELERRDLPYAGMGHNLAEARSPAYYDTPRGRVALISACSTFPVREKAGKNRSDFQGRPGLSPLELEAVHELPRESLEDLRGISELLGLEEAKKTRSKPIKSGGSLYRYQDSDDEFHFLHVGGGRCGAGDVLKFTIGDEPRVRYEVNDVDERQIFKQIREANRQADWVVLNLHSHEGADGHYNHPSVPEFLEQFARDSIDEGVDVFACQGPHLLRGIEVYNGAPIFYSLSNFIFQGETQEKLPQRLYDVYALPDDATPADLYDVKGFDDSADELVGRHANTDKWKSILPLCHFDDGELDHVELHPIDLGMEYTRPRRGHPLPADGEMAEEIIADLRRLSEPYGTEIASEGDLGIVKT